MPVTIPSKPKKSKVAESILNYIDEQGNKVRFTVADVTNTLGFKKSNTVYMLLYVLFKKGLLEKDQLKRKGGRFQFKSYWKSEKWSPEIAGLTIREHYDTVNENLKKWRVNHKTR